MLDNKTIKYLEAQPKSEFKFEKVDKLKLTYELLENIGEKDSHLRDDIIYPCLAHLLHDNHLDKQELIKITKNLISDQYLTYDMDNKLEYSALKRSFTSLQLVIIIHVHNRDNIFSKAFIKEIFDSIIDYYSNEKDLRGYDPSVGWIHSIAHAADMFSQLAKCLELEEKDFESMLKVISEKFKINSYSYVSDEDERTVNAIFNLLERDIVSKDFMKEWVNKLGDYDKPNKYPEAYRITGNVKSLLRSLYFRVLDNEKYEYLANEVKKVLKEKVKLR